MEIYALDNTNIDSFEFLVTPPAAEALRRGDAHGFCVREEDQHVGALVGRFTGQGEYEILSLFVLPEFRRQGVGELLLETLQEVLAEYDANVSITFACLSNTDKELKHFLESQDFEEHRSLDSHLFATTVEELMNSKLKSTKSKVEYPCFAELNNKQLSALEELSGEGFIPKPLRGFSSDRIEAEMSTAIFKGKTPIAYAAVERENDDMLMLTSLYVNDPDSPSTLLKLLRCVLNRVNEKYTEDTVILLPAVTEESEEMFTTLFDENTQLDDVMYTFRKFFPSRTSRYADLSIEDFLIDHRNEYYGFEDEEGAYLTDIPELTE